MNQSTAEIITKTTKRFIKPLPKNVINKIAAGEVVERPSAVVKELVENAIDASADKIDIIIEKSGIKLIKIIDNGCGISSDQMEIAFSRHATSKIREFNDLDRLASYGFRGEALPSIASVSRLRMLSRTQDSDVGEEIIFEGGILKSKEPHSASFGTMIEVENLFYNTPARRKFLKAESTEARHISRIAMAMAIGRPNIGFTYKLNGRTVFNLPKGQTLRERVKDIVSSGDEVVAVSSSGEVAKIEGYVGLPQSARNNRNGLFLFINNRFIQSATLGHGVSSGYKELLPRGKFPIGVIHLTIEPTEVDVNVHPTKIEVRLAREREIHDFIYSSVKSALREDGIIPSFVATLDSSFPNASHSFTRPPQLDSFRQTDGSTSSGISRANRPITLHNNRFENKTLVPEMMQTADGVSFDLHTTVNVDKATGEIIETQQPNYSSTTDDKGPSEQFEYLGRLASLYLIIKSGSSFFILDQHTAHERVLYEETLAKIEKEQVNGQQLLFPAQVELNPEQFALFEESISIFKKSGFSISEFGGRTVNIEAVPAVLSKKSPEKIFVKIIDDISNLTKAGLDIKKGMAQSIACRAAVMAGDKLNDDEAVALIKALIKCDNRYACPHGRPTFIRISKDDLDRQFGRA